MTHFTSVLVVIAWLTHPVIVVAQQPPPEIVTGGAAQVILPPDRALVSIGIMSRGSTAVAAANANVRPVTRVRDTLAAIGFPRDSVRVESYTVEANEDYERGGKIVDYEASTVLKVRLRALDMLGSLFDAAMAGGATRISEIQFESDTAESARRHALAVALGKARADAEALATAAGGRLGRLLSVSTPPQSAPGPVFRLEEIQVSGLYGPAKAPMVNRDVLVAVNVQTKWEFIPNP